MTNKELNTLLREKMDAEQTVLIGRLLRLDPEKLLEHSLEYTVRQDFLISMKDNLLTDDQAKALLHSETPLADLYKEYQKQQSGYIDDVRDSIVACANSEIRKDQERRAALRDLPVYSHTAEYARDHGELEQYRESKNANIACRTAVEEAITAHYQDNRLDGAAVKQVVDAFGYDRTLYILAATVQYKEWDGRISRSSKEWARTIPVAEDRSDGGSDMNVYIIANRSHPGLLDLFLKEVRSSQALEQSKEKPVEKERPSMLARLREDVQNNSPNHSAKLKDPER